MGELDFPVVARGRGVTNEAELLRKRATNTWPRMQGSSCGHEGQAMGIDDPLHALARAHIRVKGEAMLAHNVFEQLGGQSAVLFYASRLSWTCQKDS